MVTHFKSVNPINVVIFQARNEYLVLWKKNPTLPIYNIITRGFLYCQTTPVWLVWWSIWKRCLKMYKWIRFTYFLLVFVLLWRWISCWVFPQWYFGPVILIICEVLVAPASADGGGRKEVYNHVQLVLLHILSEPFHCANDLFVPIICFAELVNPRAPQQLKRFLFQVFQFTARSMKWSHFCG